MLGTVHKWLGKKGYGFIKGDDGNDYFVHYEFLKDPYVDDRGKKDLPVGERVEFDPTCDSNGWKAYNIRPHISEEKARLAKEFFGV